MTQINALPCTQVGEDEVANVGIEEEDAEHDCKEGDGADESPDDSDREILHDALYTKVDVGWGYGDMTAWEYRDMGVWG